MKRISLSTAAALLLSCSAQGNRVEIDLAAHGADVPPSLYGIFFEEINHAGDGGLYAELIRNRSFEDSTPPEGYRLEDGKLYPPALPNHLTGALPPADMTLRWDPQPVPAWSLRQTDGKGAATTLTRERPLDDAAPVSLRVTLPEEGCAELVNEGFWGMNIVGGERYRLLLHTQAAPLFRGTAEVRLIGMHGETLCRRRLELDAGDAWQRHEFELTALGSDPRARFVIELRGEGSLKLDYVSLFPVRTFRGRENGLREDVARTLEALRPAFVRWPGGGIVEGFSLSNRVRWKQTLGDPVSRPGNYDLWGYRNSYGFGYHEFLQLCEDLDADAMFVCNAGLGGQAAVGDACPEEEVDEFIADALDAIDYALGDGTTEWSRRRVENGHPEPFPLKYVEIGNENWGPVYAKRYDRFYRAIKAEYPALTVISACNLGEERYHETADMIDPHIYASPEFFFGASRMFDHRDRNGCGIYLGEYAVNQNVGDGCLLGALAEAAFLTGVERNSDLVRMASYAPLFENVNDRAWSVNLIRLDSYRVAGRSSYYVQKMFAENRPTYNVAARFDEGRAPFRISGRIGLGGWNTDSEFRDLRVTLPDGRTIEADMSGEWIPQEGVWDVVDGTLCQTGQKPLRRGLWNSVGTFGDCTISFRARKIAGQEGFVVYFGMKEDGNGYLLNIGGWGNRSTAFMRLEEGVQTQIPNHTARHIETGRWYDVRVDIRGNRFACFVDGVKELETELCDSRRFIASGYDERSGDLIVKCVNATAEPFETEVSLSGVHSVARQGQVIVLSSANPDDENTLDEPKKIFPVETTYDKFAERFDYTFEPWSFTVLRIGAQPSLPAAESEPNRSIPNR